MNKKGLADIVAAISLILLTTVVAIMVAGFVNKTLFVSELKLSEDFSCLDYQTTLALEIKKDIKKHPFFGYGVTGVGFVDGQYPLILGEGGIVGLIMFLWLIGATFKSAWRSFKGLADDDWSGADD